MSTSQVTINYLIINNAHLSTLQSKTDAGTFRDTLNTKITEQAITIGGNIFQVSAVGTSAYEAIPGKICVHDKLFFNFH